MMGMLGDKKKMIQLILSESPAKAEEKEVPQGLEGDFSKAHDAMAKDLIEGFKAGDPGMVSRALKQFIKLCSKEEDYSEIEGE